MSEVEHEVRASSRCFSLPHGHRMGAGRCDAEVWRRTSRVGVGMVRFWELGRCAELDMRDSVSSMTKTPTHLSKIFIPFASKLNCAQLSRARCNLNRSLIGRSTAHPPKAHYVNQAFWRRLVKASPTAVPLPSNACPLLPSLSAHAAHAKSAPPSFPSLTIGWY